MVDEMKQQAARKAVLYREGKAQKKFKKFEDIEIALSMYYSGASYFEVADYFFFKWTVIEDLNRDYVERSERQEAFKQRQSDIGLKGVAAFKKKMQEDIKFAKKMSDRMSGENNICKLPGVREKILADWQQNKDARVASILKVRFRKKTSFEQIVEDIILKNRLPYFYCGDGKVVIGGKCPDFIHKNRKIVVEVFDDYHHEVAYASVLNYREARTAHFRKFGYETLFIPQQFISDDNLILKTLGEQQERQG